MSCLIFGGSVCICSSRAAGLATSSFPCTLGHNGLLYASHFTSTARHTMPITYTRKRAAILSTRFRYKECET